MHILMRLLRDAILSAVFLGVVMTFGDFLWSAMRLPHRVGYGIAHGAVMCLCIGLVIGWRTRRVGAGALAGPLIGVVAALTFYALAPWLGYSAMLPAWMLFWVLFAFLQHRLLREHGVGDAALRGLAAAALSGIAFYAISGIWTKPAATTNYVVNFAAWSVAFLPGFVALFWSRGQPPSPDPEKVAVPQDATAAVRGRSR